VAPGFPAPSRTVPPRTTATGRRLPEDQDLIGRRFQQRVLGGLHGVGVADLAGCVDAAAAQLLQHLAQTLLGLFARLVDVAERVLERRRLDRRNHHPQLQLAVAGDVADLVDRLAAADPVGDDRQHPVSRRRRGHADCGLALPPSPPRPKNQVARAPAAAPIPSRVAVRIGSRFSFEAAPWAVCFAVDLTALRASFRFAFAMAAPYPFAPRPSAGSGVACLSGTAAMRVH
jgi:hypothetical protein